MMKAGIRRSGNRSAEQRTLLSGQHSAVDIALAGVVVAILAERVGSASKDRFTKSIDGLVASNASAEGNYEVALNSLMSANAELSLLNSLVKNARSEVETNFKASKMAEAVYEASTSRYQDPLEQLLADRTLSSTSLEDPGSQQSTPDGSANLPEQSYTDQLGTLQSASDEFLSIMRQLFAEELESVMARQGKDVSPEDETQIAEEEPPAEEAQEVAEAQTDDGLEQAVSDDSGFGSPWLGLLGLGLGGGGGGGGGGIASAAGGFAGFGIDGYVANALVFWDVNSNFIQDANETVQTTTAADGSYSLTGVTAGVGQIVISGGVDTSTLATIDGLMAASTDVTDTANANVTPLTMLKAQGVSESDLLTMIGQAADGTADTYDTTGISIDSFDPIAVLNSATATAAEQQAAGSMLLKAQQMFAVVNSVSALAQEAGASASDAISATLTAMAAEPLDSFVGEGTLDVASVQNVIDYVGTNVLGSGTNSLANISATAASAITNVNTVIGQSLADPANALGSDARAAALVSQQDLVSEFRAIGQLDPDAASAIITSKLNASFSDVASIKANFADVYASTIALQAKSEGGILTGSDDLAVKIGAAQRILVSDLLANDVNNGTGELRLVSIEPGGLAYSTSASASETQTLVSETLISPAIEAVAEQKDDSGVVIQEAVAAVDAVYDREYSYSYAVTVPNSLSTSADPDKQNDYVKLDVGPLVVQTRILDSDSASDIATRLADALVATMRSTDAPIDVSVVGSEITLSKSDGSQFDTATNPITISSAPENSAVDARIVTIEGVEYVEIDSSVATSARLNYIVANDAGQGHGLLRLTIEPDFRQVSLQADRAESIDEDGILSLIDQIDLTGTASAGVQEILFFKLGDVGGATFSYTDDVVGLTTINQSSWIQVKDLASAKISMPTNYHGEIPLIYKLDSHFDSGSHVFTESTRSEQGAVQVNPVAEAPADQAQAVVLVGSGESPPELDLSGSIIPSVSGDPSADQVIHIRLDGGDPVETKSIEFENIPSGMQVLVSGVSQTVSFGKVVIPESLANDQGLLEIQFKASDQLINSQFGLSSSSDPIRATVISTEEANGSTSRGTTSEFRFDIGGEYGLTVASRALTLSDEDVAAIVGSLDVASVADDALLAVSITLNDPAATLADKDSLTTDLANASHVSKIVDASAGTVTYQLSADNGADAKTLLDDIRLVPSTDHFKGTVTVNASFAASRIVTDTEGNSVEVPLASTEKGPLSVTFVPVPDLVSYTVSVGSLSSPEDHSIDLSSVFFNAGSALAVSPDPGEIVVYELTLPSGARVVDGSVFTGKSGDELGLLIAQSASIGRLVDGKIQLTVEEAENAHLVVASDSTLSGNLSVSAFSREPTTGEESARVLGLDNEVVAITAVADTPYISLDPSVRGLVDAASLTELGLESKALISIPVSAALEDGDGSETLWISISPDTETIADFDFNVTGLTQGNDYQIDSTRNEFLVKADLVNQVTVSRPDADGGNAYDGSFTIEAIAIEGSPQTADAALGILTTGTDGVDYVGSSSILAVEFLQPATKPDFSLTTQEQDNSLLITPTLGTGNDTVTILATKVPSGAKFVREGTTEEIGVPAEIDGVWVFSEADFSAPVRMVLPDGYDGSNVEPAEIQAFAVDQLGLTSAQSDTETFKATQVGATQTYDPIIIDTAGDGIQFGGSVEFDIDADTDMDSLGWVTGSDDAFLVLLNADGSVPTDGKTLNDSGQEVANGSVLLTEYLVDPASTNALQDLIAADPNKDGVFAYDEFATASFANAIKGNTPFLWFDDSDGVLEAGELRSLSSDFSINLNAFSDNQTIDATGAIIAATASAGAMSGTFDDGGSNRSLADASISDVYLPSVIPTKANSVVNAVSSDVLLEDSVGTESAALQYFEDNPDGFALKSALASDAWLATFSDSARAAILEGSGSVLLSIRSTVTGSSFNLSQGARLEGEPTDTWLTVWDFNNPPDKLTLFGSDHFSGQIPLEFRATAVYGSGLNIQQETATRNVTLDISAAADRPDISLPSSLTAGTEGSVTLNAELEVTSEAAPVQISLSGLSFSSPDTGETLTLVIKPSDELSGLVGFSLNGTSVEANDAGHYEVLGPLSDGGLVAVVPAYLSGKFIFLVDAVASEPNNPDSVRSISDLPLQFSVNAVAQGATVDLVADESVTETDRSIDFTAEFDVIDNDGSEEIAFAEVRIELTSADQIQNLLDTKLIIDGVQYALSQVGTQSVLQAFVPANALSTNNAGVQTLVGVVQTPQYFDGTVSMSVSPTTVEASDFSLTERIQGLESSIVVDAVSEGVNAEETAITGVTVEGGVPVVLSDFIQVGLLDPDETLTVRLTGLPTGSSVTDQSDSDAGVLSGSTWSISGLVPADLADYKIVTQKQADSFELTVSLTTVDGTATESSATQGTAFFDVDPVFTPVLVDSNFEEISVANGNIPSIEIDEGGQATLSGLNVLLGQRLNPSNAEVSVTIESGSPDIRFRVSGTSDTFKTSDTVSAAELANGLEFDLSNDANVSGDFSDSISIQLEAVYESGNTVSVATRFDVLVAAVTDGVQIAASANTLEDTPVNLLSLITQKDSGESIDSITVESQTGLQIEYLLNGISVVENLTSAVTLATSESINSAKLIPSTNDSTDQSLTVSVTTTDPGKNGAEAADSTTDSQVVSLTVTPVNDTPTVANVIVDQAATEDSLFEFTLPSNTFADVDASDSLTLTATLTDGSTLPSWLSFDASTGKFSGTPLNANVGTLQIKVTATDDGTGALHVSDTFDLVVANTNDTPTLVNSIADQVATEEAAFSFTLPLDTFDDVDVNDTLTLSAKLDDGSDLPSWLAFDANTGTFSGTPSNNDLRYMTVVVTATDSEGVSATDNFIIDVAGVADTPVKINNQAFTDPADLITLFETSARSNELVEPIINDGRIDINPNLELFLSLEGAQTQDQLESLVYVVAGNAVTENAVLTIGSTDYTAALNATTGAYEIVIDPTSYTFSGGNGVLSVPKREIGYGNRELSVTIRTTDESSVNEAVTETTALSVFSTIPPVPFVQPVSALDLTDSADWSGTGIPLLDLIRIPEANESHVLELVNLSNGATVEVDSQPVATSPLASGAGIYSVQSTNPFETISVVRIPFSDLENATIVLDATVMAGSASLDFDARVGTSDGGIDGDPANGIRYVYSKLVETSITVDSASAGDDIVFSDGSSDDSLGSGNDVVVVTASSGQGDLFGGQGVDTLDLSALTGSQGAIVDLNLQKLILPDTSNTGVVRDFTGFEVIQGTEQSDTIVGNDSSDQPIIIRGGGGSDRIIAGSGDDVIEGGSGGDSLTGGEGADTFVFTPDSGDDRIEDFNLGVDKLVFAGFGLTFLSDGNWPSEVTVEASGADLKISITSNGSTQTLTLAGLAASVDSPELLAGSEFTETLDLEAPNLGIDLTPAPVDYAEFIADREYREGLLGDNFDFSDDGLSSVLGVIADVKLEEAVIRNSLSPTDGFRTSIDPDVDANGPYVGLAGSLGDDLIIGTDYDDLLFGGLDGEDKIIGGSGNDDILLSRTRSSDQQEDSVTVSGDSGADVFTFIEAATVQQGLENISQARDVLVKDFNRAEGDRLQLVGYDDLNNVTIGDVGIDDHQTVVLEDGLTVMFDLSFAREFDSNFALRLADFDKFEG